MGEKDELNDFERGEVLGCHRCGKSVREISVTLRVPRSTVNDIIVK